MPIIDFGRITDEDLAYYVQYAFEEPLPQIGTWSLSIAQKIKQHLELHGFEVTLSEKTNCTPRERYTLRIRHPTAEIIPLKPRPQDPAL